MEKSDSQKAHLPSVAVVLVGESLRVPERCPASWAWSGGDKLATVAGVGWVGVGNC